jgi:P-type Cu+ transporter
LEGILSIKITKIGSETLLSQIVKLVEESQVSKAPIQRYADFISSIFVPTVVFFSISIFFFWLVLNSYLIPESWIPKGSSPFLLALNFSMTVLVVGNELFLI